MANLGPASVGIFVLVLNIGSSLGASRMYSGQNCTGIFLKLPHEGSHSSLSDYGFDNVAKSVKLDGKWLLYDLPGFNEENTTAISEYVSTPSDTCYNLTSTFEIVSSLNAIGSDGWDSLDLFTMSTFAGPMQTIIGDMYSLKHDEHASAILMGESSWTIYSGSFGASPAYCLFPEEGSSQTWINDFQQLDPPIPYGFIQSVAIGCRALDAIHVRLFSNS